MDHSQRRRPTIAKEWQLAVLKKLQSESSNPTEGQRSAAAAETGLCVVHMTAFAVVQAYPPFSETRSGSRTGLHVNDPRLPLVTEKAILRPPVFTLRPSRRSSCNCSILQQFPLVCKVCHPADRCQHQSILHRISPQILIVNHLLPALNLARLNRHDRP